MTLVQDIYYCSEFKKSHESNYNFLVNLDVNITIKDPQKLKFKLINFSMMNSMLTVSSHHKNNIFRIKYLNVDYYITIPDGSYIPTSLRDAINSLITAQSIPLVFSYVKETNKYFLATTVNVQAGNLFFYPQNCASLLGFTKTSYEIIYPNKYYSDTFANMLPYAKIILTTNLVLDTNVQTNFEGRYSANCATGDIITWVPRDIALFSTINYTNIENIEIDIANKNLKTIGFGIMNEYQEYITDAPTVYLHFQIITYDNTNWYQKFFNILNDISYYLLSLYFKKK